MTPLESDFLDRPGQSPFEWLIAAISLVLLVVLFLLAWVIL